MSPNHPYPSSLPTSPNLLLSHQSTLLSLYPDVRTFLTAHAELEREYGNKLMGLVRKMEERTLGAGAGAGVSRRVREVCVGGIGIEGGGADGKGWKDGEEKNNTLLTALSTHLTLLTQTAQTHLTHSNHLTTQLLTPLRTAEQRKLSCLKAATGWVEAENGMRDKTYERVKKGRAGYLAACAEVESLRGRLERERSGGGGALSSATSALSSLIPSTSSASTSSSPVTTHSSSTIDRLTRTHALALTDCHNAKNEYVLALVQARAEGLRWQAVDGPRVAGEMQVLHRSTITRLTDLLSHSATLSSSTYETLLQHSRRITEAYARVDSDVDADQFAQYNARSTSPNGYADDDSAAGETDSARVGRTSKEGKEWIWEPAPGYYEEEGIHAGGREEVVYLQNKLVRAKLERGRLAHSIKEKEKEIEGARRLAQAYELQPGMGDADEVTETLLFSLKDVTVMGIQEEAFRHEIEVLEAVLGDDQGGQLPHDFKAGTFAVPTPCEYCQGSIWGLTKPGETCRRCGLNAHVKCGQKLPADCGGNPIERKRTSIWKERPQSVLSFASPPTSPSLANEATSPDRLRPSANADSPNVSPSSRLSMHGLRKSFARRRSEEPGATSISSITELGMPLEEILPDNSRYPDFIAPAGTHAGTHLPGSIYAPSASSSSSGHGASPVIPEESEDTENPFERSADLPPSRHATVIWTFHGSDADEISVQSGQKVEVLEEDDGSGWVKVRTDGSIGLVPSGYIKLHEVEPQDRSHGQRGPRQPERQQTLMPAQNIVSPPPSAAQHWVEALYKFAATEQDETDISPGEVYQLTLRTAPTDEWWEVVGKGGRRGLVPATYVRAVRSERVP